MSDHASDRSSRKRRKNLWNEPMERRWWIAPVDYRWRWLSSLGLQFVRCRVQLALSNFPRCSAVQLHAEADGVGRCTRVVVLFTAAWPLPELQLVESTARQQNRYRADSKISRALSTKHSRSSWTIVGRNWNEKTVARGRTVTMTINSFIRSFFVEGE